MLLLSRFSKVNLKMALPIQNGFVVIKNTKAAKACLPIT